jgi:hypothetical protein
MQRAISVAGQQRRKFWGNQLRAWQASGQSQVGYCRKHGLSCRSFVYWKKEAGAKSCGLPGGGAEIVAGAGFASLQAAASHAGESIRH